MDLERRVEALEKELQILKAQIQATLLDIQEQILTNAYPTLRAENAAPPPERPTPGAANPITVLAATPGGAARPDPRDDDDAAGPVNVRRVSLNDLDDDPAEPPANSRGRRDGPAEPPAPSRKRHDAPTQPVPLAQDLDLTALSRLEEWATEKLEHMGVARTKQLIRMYAEQGRFNLDVEATLLKFVSIYEETSGPLPALPSRGDGARKTVPASSAPAARRPAAPSEPEPAPRKKAPPAGNSNPAMKTVPAEPTPRKKGPGEPPSARPVGAPDPAGPPSGAPAGDDDDQASVVLKLIAGIHNAGAGVKWRKKDG